MLSPSALLEIRTELDALRAFEKKVAERIAALEAIQQPFDLAQGALPLGRPSNGTHVPMRGTATEVLRQMASKYSSTGLRAAILDALRAGPMRAPQVAAILKDQGFTSDSPTPLTTRVYNDLWRMKEAGTLEGRPGGIFALKS